MIILLFIVSRAEIVILNLITIRLDADIRILKRIILVLY